MANVLLILADDLRSDLLVHMPFVNGTLRKEGTTYSNAFVSVPLCSPARAGLYSGRYALRAENGVYVNDTVNEVPNPAANNLPVWLDAAGVATGFVGKYTKPGQTSATPGWDYWRCLSSSTQSAYGYVAKDAAGTTVTPAPPPHAMDYVTARTLEWLTTAGAGPWFTWLAPTNPHIDPSTLANNPSIPGTANRFLWHTQPLTRLTSTAAKPSWISGRSLYTPAEEAAIQAQATMQIQEAYDLDRKVKIIYDALAAAGTLASTTIIFTSDSGVHYGEQRFGDVFAAGKSTPYDVSFRAPLIIRGPGFTAGANVAEAACLQDVTATTCAILGATPTTVLDGIDLRGGIPAGRAVLYEHTTTLFTQTPSWPAGNGVATRTHTLVKWNAADPDQWEMYDRTADPGQLTNLAYLGGAYLTKRNELDALRTALLVPT